MTKKRILVTGGAGYIGSHTCVEMIESGRDPILLDNFAGSDRSVPEKIGGITGKIPKTIDFDCCDGNFPGLFSENDKISGVIHFAAFKSVSESYSDPLGYYANNINSTINVLKAMKAGKIPYLIFSSSATVYGTPDTLPIGEDATLKIPASPYGKTKFICENIILDYAAQNPDFRFVILRYFNPIGAHPSYLIGENPQGIPNNLVPVVTQTAIGKLPKLIIYGDDYDTPDGTCIRDFIHVSDLARAHIMAINYLENGGASDFFNVGTGKGTSVMEIIRIFEAISGKKLNYEIGPRRQGDVMAIWANCEKISTALGWKPRYTVGDAIGHAWAWEQSNLSP